jgi:thymidylate synthase
MPYHPICQQSNLCLGEGTVIIVTGWTPVEEIAQLIPSDTYAAIGNLFAPAGTSYLIRNILANPLVTGVLLLSLLKQDENAGSVQAMHDFFIQGEAIALGDIPPEEIERVRNLSHLRLYSLSGAAELLAHVNYLSSCPALGGEPQTYPPKIIESVTVPGTPWGHRIEGETIAKTWVKILHRIRSTGKESDSSHGKRQEIFNLLAVVTAEPEHLSVPDWLPVDRPYLDTYFPQILEDAPAGVKYTYGSRLRSHFGVDQVEQIISKLVLKPDSASAVMILWDVQDHCHSDPPCLNHIWVRVADNALSLTAVFRSNDMFGAWCANAFGLRALQAHLRDRYFEETGMPLELAPLMTLSESAHIYDHSYNFSDKVIHGHYGKGKKQYNDPVGNYLVTVEDNQVVVNRMRLSGETCRQYQGRNFERISAAIALDAPAMSPNHALYLGREITKALSCLQSGQTYHQA